MLEIDSVSLRFGNKSVLSGCYLSCRPGEIVGLLGRNGSGKSSLLKIIFGTLNCDFRYLRIDDRHIRKKGFKTGYIAYLPQENLFPPFMKIKTILKDLIPADDPALNEFINKITGKRIGDLSGGEERLLACLWILNQPAGYILLDEPFSGISPLQIELLQQYILQAGRTKGIILTDHIYTALLEVSNRIVLLHNNAIYQIKTEEELVRYNYIPY